MHVWPGIALPDLTENNVSCDDCALTFLGSTMQPHHAVATAEVSAVRLLVEQRNKHQPEGGQRLNVVKPGVD